MDDQAAREKLAAALPESLGPVGLRRPAIPQLNVEASLTGYGLALLDALLPVVREIAAEELREAADGLTWDGLLRAADYAGYAATLVRARADALTESAQ